MSFEATAPEKKTRQAYIWTSLLRAPFWTLYGMLFLILHKELHATPFQISLFIALKPIVSLFSVYWSAIVHKRPDRLRSNVILAGVIGYLPFFFFAYIQNVWLVIAASGIWMMMDRGILPAWMEILKRNLPKSMPEKTFSLGSALSFLCSAIFPIFFGRWMDVEPSIWTRLFPLMALLGLAGMIFQWRIPIQKKTVETSPDPINLKAAFLKPWKNTWNLFKARPDFIRYQIGFMLGGSGLMVMQPVLPAFFSDVLNMSYTEMAIALGVCKGIGFALTSRIWAGWLQKVGIFRFSSWVTILAAVFPLALLMGQVHLSWVYIAYLAYGIMQAGSHLSWHFSGPLFSKEEDSSAYSSVNVVTVGIRGLFAPFLGSILFSAFGATWALLFGGALCFCASLHLMAANRRIAEKTPV